MPNITLSEFASLVKRNASQYHTRERAALSEAAHDLAERAKSYIGDYQGAVPPFPFWPPLAPSTMEDRMRRGYTPNDPLLREGELRDSIGGVVEGHSAVVGTHSKIAPYQEFGTRAIPPRAFIGRAVADIGRREAEKVALAVFWPILTGR